DGGRRGRGRMLRRHGAGERRRPGGGGAGRRVRRDGRLGCSAMAPKAPRILPGAAALGLVLAACGGRVALDVPDCSGDAVAYCKTDGCPLTGPAASTPTGVSVWCTGST